MCDVLSVTPSEGGELFAGSLGEGFDRDYFEKSISGLSERLEDIDGIISGAVDNWKFDRISIVDRNILRLGTFELFFSEITIPHPVAINEAVELAKRFGTEESGAFVNGILDAIRKKMIMNGGGIS